MSRHFFATADDLLPVFERVEAKRALAYTRTGLFLTPALGTEKRGALIPTLHSPAPGRSASNGPQYLVTLAGQPVVVCAVPQRAGGVRFTLDQLANPDSIVFQPGGIYPPDVLLYGSVGTVSRSPVAQTLQRAFASAIGKHFQRVRAFWVGPVAWRLWQAGYRLTAGVDSPREYDLAAETASVQPNPALERTPTAVTPFCTGHVRPRQ